MPRSTRSLLVALCCLIALPSFASREQTDAFLARQPNQPLALSDDQLSSRGISVNHTEGRLGVPTFLTVIPGSTLAVPLNKDAPVGEAARAHLLKVSDVFRLDAKGVSDAQLRSIHDTGVGGVIAQFGQRVDGIEVFRAELNVLMTRQRSLVAVSGYLAPSASMSSAANTARTAFPLRDTEAVSVAYTELTGSFLGAGFEALQTRGDYTTFAQGKSSAIPLDRPARAKKVFFILPEGLQAGYYVELFAKVAGVSKAESFVISARDGQVLFRNNLTADVASTYRVFADSVDLYPYDGPQGTATSPKANPTPDRFQAPFLSPQLVTLQNYPFSKNDPWLPAGATTTSGNNVDAYLDATAPDGFNPNTNDLRPANTSANTFDYSYDTSLAPNANATNKSAAVVNLFYTTNFLHDFFYDVGFDEQAGNAQLLNYGRGGLEGDVLHIEGQDNSGRNNANMSTPSDGASPRMQQYIFDGVPVLDVTAPASVAGNTEANSAAFGAPTFDLTGTVKIPSATGTTLGCSAFPAGTFTGQIAAIDRGTCTFKTKAKNAQDAGAVGMVLVNSAANAGTSAPGLGDDATVTGVTIPVLSVTYETGVAWKAEVQANNTTIALHMKKTADLDRDSAIDNDIVAHEWGHYISNRLIVDANGLSNNMGRSMGEGWADFNAMLVNVRAQDINVPSNANWGGVYALATYTQSGGANNGYYYGIRRTPYSTDLSKNSLFFRHFGAAVALPTTSSYNFGKSGLGNTEVHSGGEVWATMLWECYASLLNAYPFSEAQNRMKSYIVAAYKLTPMSPTLLEARDAVLAAAQASDPADYTRFAAAFAKRGAGFGAKIGDRDSKDHFGIVESYSTTSALEVTSAKLDDSITPCDGDGALDKGETGLLTITVKNTGATALTAFTGTVTANGTTATLNFPAGNTMTFPALAPGASATRNARVVLTATSGSLIPTAGLTIAFNEPTLSVAYQSYTFDPQVNFDDTGATLSDTETFDNGFSNWTAQGFSLETVNGNTYAVGHANGSTTDATLTSPWMEVKGTGNFTVSFNRKFTFESNVGDTWVAPYYDGAVMEITDDGVTWYDLLNDLGVNPGYADYLEEGGTNPLAGRPAFVGISTGYPAFGAKTVNLGTMVASSKVKLRFRVGADEAVGSYGFAVDNVKVTNVVANPFSARSVETSNGTTCNHRPVAKAGPPQSSPEYDVNNGVYTLHNGQLNGTGSFDADGSPLTYRWTQVSLPTLTLTGANTATPTFSGNVDKDTVVTFQLVVNDGTEDSLPSTVDVLVRNVNQKPVAVATTTTPTIPERPAATVTLDGTGSSDPDDQPLTYTWTQTAGPAVTLTYVDPADKSTASFDVAEVTADTDFTFQLVVNDGIDDSAPTTVTVKVTNVDRAPVANAGTAQSVAGRAAVQLTGTATDPDGDAVTYAWTQVAGSTPAVTLTNANTATASFTSPDVKAQTVLHFQLVASSNGLNSAPATVDVTVAPDKAPTAIAGGDRAVPGRTAVQLTGTGFDPEGDALTYAWTQSAGPNVTLTGANTAVVSFTSPDVKQATTLTFKLIVSADGLDSQPSFVNVAVAPDSAPVAITAGDLTVKANAQVTLAGNGSDAEGDTLNYKWTQVAGPTVAIQSSTAQTTTFFAPGGTTDLKFTLQVFANELASAPATLNVHVEGDKAVPTVTVANAAISADEKTVVKLEATGTPGTDGDTLKFTWEQRGGDTVQLADASSPTATFTAPDVTGEKSFVFAVTATDSQGLSSAPAIVVVDVKDLDTTKASGCGCTSGTSSLVPFAALFAMAWFRRRKQA